MQILMMLVWQWRGLMNKYILTKRQVVNELSTFYSFLLGFLIALMIGSIILLIKPPLVLLTPNFKISFEIALTLYDTSLLFCIAFLESIFSRE